MSGYGDRQQAQTNQIPIWKPEKVGDKHEGVYTGLRQLDPQYKALYIVGDKLVPAKKQVETAFASIPVGSYIWLEFKGKEAIKGGKTVNNFDIGFAVPKGGTVVSGKDPADDDEVPF